MLIVTNHDTHDTRWCDTEFELPELLNSMLDDNGSLHPEVYISRFIHIVSINPDVAPYFITVEVRPSNLNFSFGYEGDELIKGIDD